MKKHLHWVVLRKELLLIAALVAIALLLSGIASNTQKPFASAEVKFTDASPHGLAIVPASCPSAPPHFAGDTGVPNCSSSGAICTLTPSDTPPDAGRQFRLTWRVTRPPPTGGFSIGYPNSRHRFDGSINPGGLNVTDSGSATLSGSRNVTAPNTAGTVTYTLTGTDYYRIGTIHAQPLPATCTASVTVGGVGGGSCTGSLPSNATACTGDTNPAQDLRWLSVTRCTSERKCQYTESAGVCTGLLPSNATACTGDTNPAQDLRWLSVTRCTSERKCQYTQSAGACTGSLPSNATVCTGDTNPAQDLRWLSVTRCTSERKCQYTQSISQCTPPFVCRGNDLYRRSGASCTESLYQSCDYGCSGGACIGAPPPSIVTWSVRPLLVQRNNAVQVKWKADYVASCTVTSTNNDSWSCLGGACSTEIIQTSKLINAQTVFTILCQGLEGSSPPSVTDSTTVNIVPIFNEQ